MTEKTDKTFHELVLEKQEMQTQLEDVISVLGERLDKLQSERDEYAMKMNQERDECYKLSDELKDLRNKNEALQTRLGINRAIVGEKNEVIDRQKKLLSCIVAILAIDVLVHKTHRERNATARRIAELIDRFPHLDENSDIPF